MAKSHDPTPQDDMNDPEDLSGVPYEQEPMEVEDDAPRRAASARFVVDARVGSDAALRDAMDPANQSLAEALRLSYRVLQAVILVLVVLFLASGFRTVDDGKSGVQTVWGRITSSEPLSPGPKFSFYPYPAGDFLVFDVENRGVELATTFAPASRGRTQEQMLETAEVSAPIRPGTDGALLTRDGDLSHLEFSARYIVEQPVKFVNEINDDDAKRNADRLVTLALQRAAIHVTAGVTLQELTDLTEDLRQRVQKTAQQVLDELGCGIQIAQVQLHRGYAPLAIERALGDVTAARASAGEGIERAEQAAGKLLQSVAGEQHRALMQLIDDYEDALDRDDPKQEEILASINGIFEGESITGEAAEIIQNARAYQSQIENTLGLEYKRFASLLPNFRENPEVFVKQHWLDVYGRVTSRPDTEVIYIPAELLSFSITLTGSAEIQEIRRKYDLERRQYESDMKNRRKPGYVQRGSDKSIDRAGRQLKKDREGNWGQATGDR